VERILNKHKQSNVPLKRKVFVGISGGVDSAVAAALLKRKGYNVHGVFMREYDLSLPEAFGEKIHCTQEGDRQSALAVAAALDIPFEEWDFRKEYERFVVRYMIREYKSGRTPNPDVLCNSTIKFGMFLQKALKRGADAIATGHYAKIRITKSAHGTMYHLLQAADLNKDQSYFLYQLKQDQLQHCLFPLATRTKPEVRMLAKKFKLPNWDRKDSQGVCFIGKLSMKEFLQSSIRQKKGKLMTPDRKVVGVHDGAAYFTIGQRHGLGFDGGDAAYYVVDKDMKKNIVIVDHQKPTSSLYKKELTCEDMHWIAGVPLKFPYSCMARIRYRQPLQKAIIHMGMKVRFAVAQRAITPGQAVVFYKGKECLGGGIIH